MKIGLPPVGDAAPLLPKKQTGLPGPPRNRAPKTAKENVVRETAPAKAPTPVRPRTSPVPASTKPPRNIKFEAFLEFELADGKTVRTQVTFVREARSISDVTSIQADIAAWVAGLSWTFP